MPTAHTTAPCAAPRPHAREKFSSPPSFSSRPSRDAWICFLRSWQNGNFWANRFGQKHLAFLRGGRTRPLSFFDQRKRNCRLLRPHHQGDGQLPLQDLHVAVKLLDLQHADDRER